MIEVSEPLPAAISASSQFAERAILRQRLAAVGDHLVDGVQLGVVVVAKPARLVVDHLSRASAAARTPRESCRPAPGPRPRRSAPRHGPARRPARRRPRRHRPAPGSRRAPAPPSPTSRAAAGWSRRWRWCRRACSPSRCRPAASARTSSRTCAQVQVCQMPRSLCRIAGRCAERAGVAQQKFRKGVRSRARVARHRFLPIGRATMRRSAIVSLSRRSPAAGSLGQ